MAQTGLASFNEVPQPPKPYALYEQVRAWSFQHLPLAGGHYDQPYLIMRQLAEVMFGVQQVEKSQNAGAASEIEKSLMEQLAKLKAIGMGR